MIKKKYFVLTAVLLVGVVLLSGCMGGGSDDVTDAIEEEAESHNVTFEIYDIAGELMETASIKVDGEEPEEGSDGVYSFNLNEGEHTWEVKDSSGDYMVYTDDFNVTSEENWTITLYPKLLNEHSSEISDFSFKYPSVWEKSDDNSADEKKEEYYFYHKNVDYPALIIEIETLETTIDEEKFETEFKKVIEEEGYEINDEYRINGTLAYEIVYEETIEEDKVQIVEVYTYTDDKLVSLYYYNLVEDFGIYEDMLYNMIDSIDLGN